MTTLLEVTGLELAYGEIAAIRDISFTVAEGEIVTFIGANGAGKSTTMRGVAGIMRPRAGTIRFDGANVSSLQSFERLMLGIALVPEGRHVFPYLSVRENLEMGGFKYRKDKPKLTRLIDQAMDWFPRLRERTDQKAGTLSGGEQQMLVLGRAMMSEPRTYCS